MPMQELMQEEHLDELLKETPLLVAYFSTPHCGVCKTLRPRVTALLEERGLPGFFIDTTRLPQTAGQRMVFAVPVVLVYFEGRELARFGRHFALADLERALDRARQHLES